jgi:acetyl esterase
MSGKRGKPDPRIAVMLAAMRLLKKEFYYSNLSPEANRRAFERDARLFAGRSERVFSITDVSIRDGLTARLYRPSAQTGLPIVLYIHGGGWVVGSIATHDHVCRKLANRAQTIVVSVGYRLAPENKFPAALEDVYTALCWVFSKAASFGGDPGRLAVAGDSAGGNLAAAVCLVTRDRGGPPVRFQALIYPGLDASNLDRESYRLNGKGYYLTKKIIERVTPLYVNDPAEVLDPYVSPLLAANFNGLPPGLVLTAEFDPLQSEGEAYAARLSSAGIPCRAHRYSGMIHGFVSFGGLLPQADRAIGEMAAALSEALQ